MENFLFTFTQKKNPSKFLVQQRVKSNEQKVASNEQKVTSNEQKVTSNEQKVTSNKPKLTSNEQKVKPQKGTPPECRRILQSNNRYSNEQSVILRNGCKPTVNIGKLCLNIEYLW